MILRHKILGTDGPLGAELGAPADPTEPYPAARPEWYFLFMFQTLKYIPSQIWIVDGEIVGILLFAVGGILWTLVPFWDRKSSAGKRNRVVTYIGIIVVLYIIMLTLLGWIA